jgi:hypothetical protein
MAVRGRTHYLPSLPPLESVDRSKIEQACEEYGVEFVGPLPDED